MDLSRSVDSQPASAPGAFGFPSRETREFEQIGGIRFSRLRDLPDQREQLPLLGWQFLTISMLSILALFGAARYILDEIHRGNFLPGQVFAIALMVILYVVPIVVTVLIPRKRGVELVERGGVYPVTISVRTGDGTNCKAKGEMGFRGPWLEFSGDTFSFRLSARDVKSPSKAVWRIRNKAPSLLKLPKGLPTLSILIIWRISPAEARQLSEELSSRFEAWANSAEPKEPSLFPPLRAGELGHSPGSYALRLLPASVLVGLACAAAPLILPEMAEGKGNPYLVGVCAFGMIELIAFSLAIEVWRRKRHNAKVEKLAAV